MSIRVSKRSLWIRDGNTHYPSDRREWRFFKGSLDIPPLIVVVDGSGEITLAALDWMASQNIPLIRLRWDGEFVSVISNGAQAADSAKVHWQSKMRSTGRERLRFAVDLIREKARYTMTTMEQHVPRSDVWEKAYADICWRTRALENRSPTDIQKLLGAEGMIAHQYFRAWTGIDIKWKGLKRYPVPDDWLVFKSRSKLIEVPRRNYRATHPVNAMLNYAYGVLTIRMQIQLIADGYDPTLGILHDRKSSRGSYPALALDCMEPMRPVVDRAVLQIINEEKLSGVDFLIQDDGCCRLNPELARRVAQLAVEHYAAVSDTAWQPLAK